jgi:diaminopimelate decarboxylase
MNEFWWEREDLRYVDGSLHLAGQDLAALAAEAGTPTFVYNAARVRANLERLHGALERHGVPHEIYFAMKSNRYLPLLTWLRMTGRCGIDACSPNELRLARQVGFQQEEIVYTNTSVSNEDIDWLARHPRVHVNCDSLSSLRRLAVRCPGRTIGLRINPQLGMAYSEQLAYSGTQATKFGIYAEQLDEALALAAAANMSINTLQFHLGSGYMTLNLPQLDRILVRLAEFAQRVPGVQRLDIGGGLGVRMRPEETGLDLEAWATLLARYARDLGVTILLEPGDYLVKDAGLLLVEVNTVEEKGGTLFVGVNAGFNLHNTYAYYDMPYAFALARQRSGPLEKMTIAGHINEVIDLFGRDVALPRPAEGDILAIMNTGGYGATMSSNHCMRGQFNEYILFPRE